MTAMDASTEFTFRIAMDWGGHVRFEVRESSRHAHPQVAPHVLGDVQADEPVAVASAGSLPAVPAMVRGTPPMLRKAPAQPVPLTIAGTAGKRPRTRDRYWLVGLYVIAEDVWGDLWVASRDELANLEPDDIVREVLPEQFLPQSIAMRNVNSVDALIAVIEKIIDFFSRFPAPPPPRPRLVTP